MLSLFCTSSALGSYRNQHDTINQKNIAHIERNSDSIATIQANLSQEQVFLSYVEENETIHVVTISKTSHEVFTVCTDSVFDHHINEFLDFLTIKPDQLDNNSKLKAYINAGVYLYNTLLRPVHSIIKGNSLIINREGRLESIPFEALMTDSVDMSTEDQIDILTLPYMLHRHAISYSFSAGISK